MASRFVVNENALAGLALARKKVPNACRELRTGELADIWNASGGDNHHVRRNLDDVMGFCQPIEMNLHA